MATPEQQQDRLDRRAAIKREYGRLFLEMSAMVFEEDPIGINFGHNADEYDPEVAAILPRLQTCGSLEDAHEVVYSVFEHFFDHGIAGPREDYALISRRVWDLWCASRPSSAK